MEKILIYLSSLHKKSIHLWCSLVSRASSLWRSACCFISTSYYFLLIHVNPFWFRLLYFTSISIAGFLLLKSFKPRENYPFNPRAFDLFFTSVSAATTSSMSSVEMESFSDAQLVVLTLLMLAGGEVFTSMVGLQFLSSKLSKPWKTRSRVNVLESLQNHKSEIAIHVQPKSISDPVLKGRSIRLLKRVVLAFLVTVHLLGITMVISYLFLVPSARYVLKVKGLKLFTFSLFTIVSTISNCGFIPTNENMIAFRKNSVLLLILIPQILAGNTLFPACLRVSIWALGKVAKKEETEYLLKNAMEVDYHHLLPSSRCSYLVLTVFGFISVQFIMFCSMQWHSPALDHMSLYEKIVVALFQSVNTRHSGENVVDISTVAPPILVLFVVMMYLPPYTSFLPRKDEESPQTCGRSTREKLVENIMLSQLSYLVVFVMAICIMEKESIQRDPLNFSVFNIVVEVISAYGNVGYTTGYRCDRRLNSDGNCTNRWYGFSGKWSDESKLILIVVMIFGKLKKFSMRGGRAWKLL